MQDCPWDFLHDGQKHIISLVGGGGKTTIMYWLANYFARQGRNVLVTTTTHIWKPERCYAGSLRQAQALWRQGEYAVIGCCEPGTGKLTAPDAILWRQAASCAGMVLIEADGSKRLPCKVPAAHEPVILPECDIVVGVAGADALGRTLEEACLRWQLGRELFAFSCNLLIDEALLVQLLLSEQGTRKNVDGRRYYAVVNKCDMVQQERALRLQRLALAAGLPPERLWLRGEAETRCKDAYGK